MKGTVTPESRAKGMDQRFISEASTATFILNMRVDDEGLGWVRDRGWEPYNPTAGFTRFNLGVDDQPTYSLTVHTRNRGTEVYAIYEQDGKLLYEHGIGGLSAFANKQYLDQRRAIPASDDPGTQYCEHGRDLFIVNGIDQPLRFRGDKRIRVAFFDRRPAPPSIFPSDPAYYDTAVIKRNQAGTIALKLQVKPRGLGDRDVVDDQIRYLYRIAWESETGSISPLSGTATAVWESEQSAGSGQLGAFGVQLRDLDSGPAGIVALRIYRTKSLINVSTQGEALYYLVARIPSGTRDYMDITPDSQLVDPAPSLVDSVPVSSGLRYIESWDGRMWAAGGPGSEQRLIYSEFGPEQFPAFNFFDCGLRAGGAITALQAYLGVLLVFRERSIEVITPDEASAGYRLTTLSPDIGTTATNTTTYVPGVGVFFLARDGVRIVTGQGKSLQLSRSSGVVARELKRLNVTAMARATAAWSEKEREWWCHYPAGGEATPSRGIVYHRDLDTWSVRAAVASSSPGAFRFNALATLPTGYFLIAPEVINVSVIPTTPVIWNMGLQVWTARDTEGGSITGAQVDDNIYSVNTQALGEKVTGQWAGRWENFGSDLQKKSVREVYVEGITVGHQPLELEYAVDWTEQYTSAGNQTASISAVYRGESEAVVYGPTQRGDSQATVGIDPWTSEKVTRLRWDVATKAISWFKWRITATSRFFVLSSRIGRQDRNATTLKQAAR